MAKNEGVVLDDWTSFLYSYHKRNTTATKGKMKYIDDPVWFEDDVLDGMWKHDGYIHRIISCVAEDMVNKGFTITGDSANIDMDEADRLNATGNMFEAMCKAQLHGGSAILFGIDDGLTLEKPVSVNSIRGMKFLRVIPKSRITPVSSGVVTDPNSADYGKPEFFEINDGIATKPYKVHSSRLFIFPWLEFSPIQGVSDSGQGASGRIWGVSVVEHIQRQVGNLSTFGDSLSHLAQEAVIGKYKLAGLAQMFAMGEDGEKKVMKRMDIINMAKSVMNGVVLDADNGEDYTRDSLQFAGMNGVADTFMIFLSGVTGIPVTRLFGRSPAGLDASGESDMKIYYDMISAYQKTMLTPFLKRLAFYIDIYKKAIKIEDRTSVTKTSRNGKNVGKAKKIRPSTETDIDIKWNPLYQMTEKERSEAYKTNAEADTMYLNSGILSREEIRVNRFLGGYNAYITVETADIPDASETGPFISPDTTSNGEEQNKKEEQDKDEE